MYDAFRRARCFSAPLAGLGDTSAAPPGDMVMPISPLVCSTPLR